MAEFKPDLMKRVIRREPNAYLAAMYYDSEMFRRQSKNRSKIEKNQEKKDYKKLVIDMLNHIDKYFDTEIQKKTAYGFKYILMKAIQYEASDGIYQSIYEGLIAGDPKKRTQRAILVAIMDENKKRK